MKKTLTHADIKKGHWYKVIDTPKHLIGCGRYPWLNMEGVAIWIDVGHNMVCVRFGECKERGIPPYCLEPLVKEPIVIECGNEPLGLQPGDGVRLYYERLGREKALEQEKLEREMNERLGKEKAAEQEKLEREKNIVTEHTAKLGQLYRITKVPDYWQKISAKQQYPSLGQIGRLMNINRHFGTLKLVDGVQRFVSFDCMELVTIRVPPLAETVVNLSDEELIKKMVLKPRSTLKIIKGLAHMNKDYRLRAFLNRGIIY